MLNYPLRSTAYLGFGLFLSLNIACDVLFPKAKPSPNAKLVEKVERCNKYGTCLVIFEDGTQGLMTRTEVGIYGCKALSERAYNKCHGEKEAEGEKTEVYEDFPE
jgi:hypothetical protein